MASSLQDYLSRRLLTEEQLRTNLYPRLQPGTTNKTKIYNLPHKFTKPIPAPGKRKCRFCNTIYAIDSEGRELYQSTCSHHLSPPPWGKEALYSCCGKKVHSAPCRTRSFHVTRDVDYNNLTDSLVTKNLPNKKQAIFALDCEFIHTRKGMEIASISIVDQNSQIVMNTLVKPSEPIIDYLELFSGLSEAEYKKRGSISTQEMHRQLSSLLGPNVILVGHGMKEDFLRIGLIHDKVIDTFVLFGGRMRCPSLVKLTDRFLTSTSFKKGEDGKAVDDCRKVLKLLEYAHKINLKN